MSNELPLVCICVPTYNAVNTVRETLESILTQTYSNLVVHVSDNASTDDTLKVIESLGDSRIIIHRNTENIGGEGNFDRCIHLAEGKYTAIFHADDIYKPDMVAKQVSFLENNPDISAVFTEADKIDERGVVFGAIGHAPGAKSTVSLFDFQNLLQTMLLHHNFLICPSAMVRTEIYKDGIREWGNNIYKSSSDVDVWLRLAKINPIGVLGEKLMGYRISKEQFSDRIRNRTERTDFFMVMDNYLAKLEVCEFITDSDIRHYRWLERHECVALSINLCALGRNEEAKNLLNDFFILDSLHAAISSRLGFVTFAAVVILRAILLMERVIDTAKVAKSIKEISWR